MPNISVDPTATTVTGTNGDDVFNSTAENGIAGSPTLIGGAGNDVYYVISPNVKIVEQAGGGTDMVVTDVSYQLSPNIENLVLWGSVAGFGNDQDNAIQGSSAANLIDGGKGNDTFVGGGGADVFQFDADSGTDVLYGWNSSCALRLSGYSQFHSITDVQAAMTQVGNDIVLKLDANDEVVIASAKIADFTAANVQLPLDMSGMHLTFDDEFNTPLTVGQAGKGLNSVWSLQGQGTNVLGAHTLLGNNEKELYVDPLFAGQGSKALGLNPYSESNGVLSLTASPMPVADQAAAYGYQFQSGAINTSSSFAQTYGYFEARMKLPTGSGSWPAFWLLREDGTWPPELDVMEAWNDTTAVQTVHTAQTGTHTMSSASSLVPGGDTSFHDYGILWTATTLTWYIDGVAVFTQPTPADMHSPMYMAIDNAVSAQNNDSNYTGSLDVDYVRAYSLDSLPSGVVTPDAATAATVAEANGGSTTTPATSGVAAGTSIATVASTAPAAVASSAPVATPAASSGTTAASTAGAAHTYWGYDANEPDGFNVVYYLAHNPDVAASGMDPLVHYEMYGKAEGRLAYDATTTAESAQQAWAADSSQPDGFNALYYLDHNPDVAKSGMNPLTHYEQYGKTEGRLAYDSSAATGTTPSATASTTTTSSTTGATTPGTTTATAPTTGTLFTAAPAVAAAAAAAPHAYWGYDANEPDGFNAVYYLVHNPDVAASGMNPLAHYEQYGKSEGRAAFDTTATVETAQQAWAADPSQPDGFNALYYLDHNPDVAAANIDPLTHYEQFGKNEGRLAYDPSSTNTVATADSTTATATVTTSSAANTPAAVSFGRVSGEPDGFNAAYYALHNPDVVASGLDLLSHYEEYGKSEGRLAYDDGSGKETSIGTSGNDHFAATSLSDHLYVGNGGADTFSFAPGIGWDTITDFDPAHDTLDVAALNVRYGAPTVTEASFEHAAMIHYAGGETILLMGVSVADAQHAAIG